MEHRATSEFWLHYHALPPRIRTSADKQFSLLEGNPQHPSLQFKKIGNAPAKKSIPLGSR
jgi:hypothetical protein